MALKDFIAVINRVDVARTNRFVVEIQPPQMAGLKPQEHVNLMCQDVSFPGQNIRTSTDDLRQGPTREIAQAVTYGNTNMTFICTPGLPEKLFFEAWQKLMYNSVTWQAKYYKSYIGQIKLRQLDKIDMVRYGVILHECYPKIINAQDYSNTASDTIQTLQVEFVYHHWSMDDEVYGPEDLWGSRGSDEGVAKRTTKAGYENMTYEQAQAFLKSKSYEDLLSDAVGSFPTSQTVQNAIGITTKATNSSGSFKQVWASLPQSRTSGPVAVEADLAPQQEEEGLTLMPAAGLRTVKRKSKTSTAAGTAEEEVSTLFCRPPRKAQVYTSQPYSGKNQAGAVINAQGSALQRLLGLTANLVANLPAAKPLVKVPGPMGYMQTVQTTPQQQLKELQAAVGTASSTWINPNTGKRATASTRSGGNLTGGLAASLGMLTGGYKGAVASSAGGIMQQALGMMTGRTGGGGGGLASLIANTRSGISIPLAQFGGGAVMASISGQGKYPTTVRYNRPGGGTDRTNHNAEGGGAEEAGVGD